MNHPKVLFIALFIWPLTLFSAVLRVNSAEKLLAQKLHPGDTILFQNGNWSDQKIILKGKGTEANPIVLRAEEPGKVFLQGDSSIKIDGIWLVVEGFKINNGYCVKGPVIEFSKASEHCRLTQTSIINFNPPEKKN
jgi:poly(beta-D-mannuronate) lyase